MASGCRILLYCIFLCYYFYYDSSYVTALITVGRLTACVCALASEHRSRRARPDSSSQSKPSGPPDGLLGALGAQTRLNVQTMNRALGRGTVCLLCSIQNNKLSHTQASIHLNNLVKMCCKCSAVCIIVFLLHKNQVPQTQNRTQPHTVHRIYIYIYMYCTTRWGPGTRWYQFKVSHELWIPTHTSLTALSLSTAFTSEHTLVTSFVLFALIQAFWLHHALQQHSHTDYGLNRLSNPPWKTLAITDGKVTAAKKKKKENPNHSMFAPNVWSSSTCLSKHLISLEDVI